MAAPAALSYSPAPKKSADATEGGKRATATITPTKAEEMPVESDKAAAAPEAKASAIIAGLTTVLSTISLDIKLISMKKVRAKAKPKPMPKPTTAVFVALRMRDKSPSAAAKAKAKIGPRSGAITMAAITMATLSPFKPMAATMEESTVRITKSQFSFVPSDIF